METKCINCGTVLTDAAGNRLLSGNFDSALPGIPMTVTVSVTWARCDKCTAAAAGNSFRDKAIELIKMRIAEKEDGECSRWYLVRKFVAFVQTGKEYEDQTPQDIDLSTVDYSTFSDEYLTSLFEIVISSYYK